MAKYNLAPAVPRIPVIAAVVAVVIYTLTRLGLAVFTSFEVVGTAMQFKSFETVPLPLWPEIFLKGFWFDLPVVGDCLVVVWRCRGIYFLAGVFHPF